MRITAAPFLFSLWLIPSEEQRRSLLATIKNLAKRHGTRPFTPHATLCSGLLHGELASWGEKLQYFSRQFTGVSVGVGDLAYTNEFFTFLFARLIDDDGQDIFRRATTMFPETHLPAVGPHLSLIYCNRPDEINREALILRLKNDLPQRIEMQSIELVTPSTGRWHDVDSWQVACTVPLA